jgi:hypothetical protein
MGRPPFLFTRHVQRIEMDGLGRAPMDVCCDMPRDIQEALLKPAMRGRTSSRLSHTCHADPGPVKAGLRSRRNRGP